MNEARKISARPLTSEERERLKRNSEFKPLKEIGDVLFGTVFFSFILYVIFYGLWHWIGPKVGCGDMGTARLVIAGIALVIVIPGFSWPSIMWRLRLQKSAWVQHCKDELAIGVANIEELDVTAAYELPEFEDEGVGFFLQLADGRVLFVQGQDLYDYAHDYVEEIGPPKPPTFPSSHMRYSYGPKTGFRLDIEPLGKFLKPEVLCKLEFQRKKPRSEYPADGEFYDGTLEDVRRKFQLKRAEKLTKKIDS